MLGLAVRRDQRKITVSALELAMMFPLAAVKVETWTATIWPGCKAPVVVAPAKKLKVPGAMEPTDKPLVSTRNKLGFGMLTVKPSPMFRLPMREPGEAVEGLSVTMMTNCV